VEGGASVSKALLASAESTEVLSGLGDDIVVEDEVDAAGLLCWRTDVSSVTQLRGCLQDKSTPQRATSPGNWVREEHPWGWNWRCQRCEGRPGWGERTSDLASRSVVRVQDGSLPGEVEVARRRGQQSERGAKRTRGHTS
jgi:hypothetical protein